MAPEKQQPHALDVALGARIRERRRTLRVSQSQLAEALGISFQQIQKYERGTNRVSFSMLILITQRLSCSVSALVGDLDGSTPGPDSPSPQAQEVLRAFDALPTDALKRSVLGLIRQMSAGD